MFDFYERKKGDESVISSMRSFEEEVFVFRFFPVELIGFGQSSHDDYLTSHEANDR